jgi:hypothetical protein
VTYHRQDIVLALLHRVVNEAKNTHQLAGKLRNEQGLGHLDQAPCRVTLGKGFQEFDAAQLKALNERLRPELSRTADEAHAALAAHPLRVSWGRAAPAGRDQ